MSVAALCEALVKAGQTVEVYTTTANGTNDLPVNNDPVNVDGVPVHYFKRITKDHSHFSPALLKHLWKNVKHFDVVHIHAWWNLVSVLSAFIALLQGRPVIISPRGTLSNYTFKHHNSFAKSILHHLFAKHLLTRSIIHTTAPAEQQSLQAIFRLRKFYIVPNFVKMPANVCKKQLPGNRPLRLLYLSRIDAKKNPDMLLHALPLIKGDYQLTMAGNGEKTYIDQLKAITHENGTAEKVDWIGFRKDDKFEVLAGHDVMVLPSQDENFANVVIESLSVGTAVVISDKVALANYVEHNNFGEICSTDAASIAGQINLLNNNKQKLTDIAQRAPGIIRHHFDEQLLVNQYLKMYTPITR